MIVFQRILTLSDSNIVLTFYVIVHLEKASIQKHICSCAALVKPLLAVTLDFVCLTLALT